MDAACPNCTTPLRADFRYCPTCAQPQPAHRLTLPHILHEAFHALTHADKGVLYLTRELARRPGAVAREYALESKRQRYFNPFAYLMLVLGLTVLVNSWTHPYTRRNLQPQAAVEARLPTPAARAQYRAVLARQHQVQVFIEKRNNVMALLAIPLLALIFWLLFRRAGLTYADHLVANAFFAGFYILFGALVLTPLNTALVGTAAAFKLTVPMLLTQLGYLTWAYYGLLNYHGPLRLLRTAGAATLALTAWMILSGGFIFLYVRFGG